MRLKPIAVGLWCGAAAVCCAQEMGKQFRAAGASQAEVKKNAEELFDGIGPRLTGSPNMAKADDWAVAKFKTYGLSNARLEDWGPFGRGWVQKQATGRMIAPDMMQLVLAAAPWSPATNGAVRGDVVVMEPASEADLAQYKGKLAGKIVLWGAMRSVPEPLRPLAHVWTDAELAEANSGERQADSQAQRQREQNRQTIPLRVAAIKMMQAEGALAVIVPSRDGENGGGTGIVFDDESVDLIPAAQLKGDALPLPSAVVTIEGYGRMYRLAKAGTPVNVELDLDTEFTGDGKHGFNALAEIPGSDPKLKDQVVMVGAHLDSWASGTGATDDGAGTLIALEAMRILTASGVRPRRTIRIALWGGEEQGLWGSSKWIDAHLGTFEETGGHNTTFASLQFARGKFNARPEYETLDAYFNLDDGSGKTRGLVMNENREIVAVFRPWTDSMKDLGVEALDPRRVRGTDHVGFDMVGIPAFQMMQDPLDYGSRTHHSNVDTYERLQFDGMEQSAIVMATMLYNTAQMDAMLPRHGVAIPPTPQGRN